MESYHPPSSCSCLPAYLSSLSILCQLWCLLENSMLWFNSLKCPQSVPTKSPCHSTPNKHDQFPASLLNNRGLMKCFCAWDKCRISGEPIGRQQQNISLLAAGAVMAQWFWHILKSLTYNFIWFQSHVAFQWLNYIWSMSSWACANTHEF